MKIFEKKKIAERMRKTLIWNGYNRSNYEFLAKIP